MQWTRERGARHTPRGLGRRAYPDPARPAHSPQINPRPPAPSWSAPTGVASAPPDQAARAIQKAPGPPDRPACRAEACGGGPHCSDFRSAEHIIDHRSGPTERTNQMRGEGIQLHSGPIR
eukprot:3931096-Pyramimonas_sp.AAC.4